MAKYRMTQLLRQTVIQKFWEEFDTSDQEAWDELRNRINNDNISLDDFPEEAPNDPSIWFSLYKELYCLEFQNREEDYWISDIKGFTEYDFILTDEKGDDVIYEENK